MAPPRLLAVQFTKEHPEKEIELLLVLYPIQTQPPSPEDMELEKTQSVKLQTLSLANRKPPPKSTSVQLQ